MLIKYNDCDYGVKNKYDKMMRRYEVGDNGYIKHVIRFLSLTADVQRLSWAEGVCVYPQNFYLKYQAC